MRRPWRTCGSRGQSTVELACILPIVVLCILLAVQAGVVMRDRLLVVHAARAAGRAVIVDPTASAAATALRRQGPPVDHASVSLRGSPRAGEVVTVVVRMRATQVPIVGRVVASTVLEEHLAVLIEGSG